MNVKFDVLDICAVSSVLYASETWGQYCKEADLCYRTGLKTAISVRKNTCNEIVYIESGKFPLSCRIIKSQLKFWLFIKKYVNDHPSAALTRILNIGLENNLGYLRYYENLVLNYGSSDNCEKSLINIYTSSWRQKLSDSIIDVDSKLGTYFRINPMMLSLSNLPDSTENERILISRYRTGSHSLAIEMGRFSNIPRQNILMFMW